MGLYTTVRWMRGIDYGTRRDGCAAAWRWSRDNDAADGCEAGTFNGGAEANERLVVFAQGSSSTVYADHADEGAAVLDPRDTTSQKVLLLGGNAPAEVGVNSERVATPAVGGPKFLEPYQMVDDVAWSNGGGKEYVRSSQQEISDTAAFNPDAVSRVRYFGSNPQLGHVLVAGEMKQSRMADEEFIYGDVLDTGPQSLPLVSYNAAPLCGGPTDPNGPKYNIVGQPDAAGHRPFRRQRRDIETREFGIDEFDVEFGVMDDEPVTGDKIQKPLRN